MEADLEPPRCQATDILPQASFVTVSRGLVQDQAVSARFQKWTLVNGAQTLGLSWNCQHARILQASLPAWTWQGPAAGGRPHPWAQAHQWLVWPQPVWLLALQCRQLPASRLAWLQKAPEVSVLVETAPALLVALKRSVGQQLLCTPTSVQLEDRR